MWFRIYPVEQTDTQTHRQTHRQTYSPQYFASAPAGEVMRNRKITDYSAVNLKLECGPMPNVMAALSNIGGALYCTPQSVADAYYQSALQ